MIASVFQNVMTRKKASDPIVKPLDYFKEPESDEDRVGRSLAVMDQFSLAMQTFETRRKGRC